MTLNILTLQKEIGEGNASRGFHEENERLVKEIEAWQAQLDQDLKILDDIKKGSPDGQKISLSRYEGYVERDQEEMAKSRANLRNYQMTKLVLIVTEVAEAVEELRHGKGASETYYPTSQYIQFRESSDEELGLPLNKPEGVPSEIADIVIRCFDFADEAGFDLFAMIEEKLEYNGTRGFRHGGKAV